MAHQSRAGARGGNPNAAMPSAAFMQPPPPTPLLKPAEVKRQFSQHADFANYAKSLKKYLNGSVTKAEFHQELTKILPSKEKLALHNWLILSVLKSVYSDYNMQKKGSQAHGAGAGSKSTQNMRGLSDHRIFKSKMLRTASQHQLAGVSDDAVSMVIVGLQQHLLRLLASVRSTQTINPEVEDVPEDAMVAETSTPGDISANDLSNAVWRQPGLLHELASATQYRLTVEN